MPRCSHARENPTRAVYDRCAGRLSIVVDAAPAPLEDVSVSVGRRRVRIGIDAGTDNPYERTIVAPDPIGDEREAVYHNGILTVTLGTEPERGD